MADMHELKQVQVRLKLSEAEPLYSTEQITTPDKAAEVMAQALAQLDREYCCVVNLDAAKHPINFNIVSIGDVNQAQVPIQNVFKSAILSNAEGIMMFHNHPSGSLQASRGDIEVTKRLVEAGKIMNIPVIDHIIVAGGAAENGIPRRFSFRENNPDMFEEKAAGFVAEADTKADKDRRHEPHPRLDPDSLMVRPTYRNFGVYVMTGENRAQVLFEGSEQECREKINELREQYRMGMAGDKFTIYQLKDDDALHDIRFEGLDWLRKENRDADRDNYDAVYEAPLKPGTTLDDIYFQFNMQRPLDFRGHSLSVSDVVALHQKDAVSGETTDKAFYVDRFGFTELPEFLKERTAQPREASEQEKASGGRMEGGMLAEEAAYKLGDRYISIQRTEEGFDYSIYDEGYHFLDGGVYDSPDASVQGILREIEDELKQPFYDAESDTYSHSALQGGILQSDTAEPIDFEELMEKAGEAGQTKIRAVRSAQEIVDCFRTETERLFRSEKTDGMRAADIEDAVREQAQLIIDAYGLDARIEDVIVSGSRCRGLEREDSDLDVAVSYSGSEREDDFFNILHDEKLFLGSLELDINPISTGQTGTLAEYLPGVEKYLSEKRIAIDKSFREPALALMEKFGYELAAEQGKEHFFTEIRPSGQEDTIGFDGWQMIHEHFKDVEELTEKYSLDTLKGRLAGNLDVIPYGILDEQLQAAIRYKEGQAVSRNLPERVEAVEQTVTFTVAECSEFHSLGELHEGIPKLEDAVQLYEKICHESSLNGIPALGIKLHTAGTSQYEDVQWDFLSGGCLDLDGLAYLPEMCGNTEVLAALHRLAEMYPEAEVTGRFPDRQEGTCGPSVQKQEEGGEAVTENSQSAESLAAEIDRISYEYDPAKYNDMVKDQAAQMEQIASDIRNGNTGYINEFLNALVSDSMREGMADMTGGGIGPDDSAGIQMMRKAQELLDRLAEYKPLAKVEEMVEENYNQIDNQLSNIPPAGDEKNAMPQEKAVHIEERKKTRSRISMKEKLAEKRAEIAGKDAKSCEEVKKPPSIGVED